MQERRLKLTVDLGNRTLFEDLVPPANIRKRVRLNLQARPTLSIDLYEDERLYADPNASLKVSALNPPVA